MTNEEFIAQNRNADVRELALSNVPAGIDLQFCLQQIAGMQTAEKKLPSWANTKGILYPPKISLEQCSSEQTALYKQHLVERLLPMKRQKMVDLTGGFGIDFSFLAKLFEEADYVESNEKLCEIAQYNFPLLGLPRARVHCSKGFSRWNGRFLLHLRRPKSQRCGREEGGGAKRLLTRHREIA